MSERDWAEKAVRAIEDELGRLLNHQVRQRVIYLLRRTDADAHARGLREGAERERQRAARVCEELAKEWRWKYTESHMDSWGHYDHAARSCRDAILRGDGGEGPTKDERAGRKPWCPACRMHCHEFEGRSVCCDRPVEYHTPCACGSTLHPVKKDNFPVPLSGCLKCGKEGPPWPDVIGTSAPQPHGPPVTADSAEGTCGPDWQEWGCPSCFGLGTRCDAALTIEPQGVTHFKPATTCSLCRGKRKVLVAAIPDDYRPKK